jgi:hypothetical protein
MLYEVRGTKGDHQISEHVRSLTKAEWVAAHYVEHGYKIEINEVVPLTSGSR